MLSFADITKANDLPITKEPVPEWGGEVCLRPLSSDDKDRYELELMKVSETNTGRIRALLVGLCLCDESGKRLVTDSQIDALGAKNGAVVDTLYQKCRKINSFDFDEAKKNLQASPSLKQSTESVEN